MPYGTGKYKGKGKGIALI